LGQKIHPIGLRIGINRDADSIWYADREFPQFLKEDWQIRRYLRRRLGQAGISKIEIERAANRVKVTIYTGKPGIIIGRGGKGIDELQHRLGALMKRAVHVSVAEVRVPDVDGQLVSENIAAQLERRVAYKRAMRQAVLRAMRLGARGIKIRVAGRLGGSEMARVELDKQGKIPLHTLRADIDYGFSEARTTYGNIGVKVWIYKGDILKDGVRPEPEWHGGAGRDGDPREGFRRQGGGRDGGRSRGAGGGGRPSRRRSD